MATGDPTDRGVLSQAEEPLENGQNQTEASEQTPLLPASPESDGFSLSDALSELGDFAETTKSVWYLILLTISIGGLQVAWSVELSNGSPYLLSLGVSKSMMALVWIAGPLTGTFVQPYIGMLSDNCRLPLGRRRPFIIGGTAATIVSLLVLAWTKDIVGGILSLFGADPESQGVRITIIVVAVVGIYVLDIAINTVQATIRALIVDCAPAHQQEIANAIASRIIGTGNIAGFLAGYSDLPKRFWFLGYTQFQVLCAFASMALAATVALSTALVAERDPRLDGPPPASQPGLFMFFLTLFKSIKRMMPQVKKVCQVQFFSWIGFFPLLFYTSQYIAELYVDPYLRENPDMSPGEVDRLYEQATRIGTFALLINSNVSLFTNIFMPFFIVPTYDSRAIATNSAGTNSLDVEVPRRKSKWERLQIPGLTLKRTWLGSLILFAGVMVSTLVVRSVTAGTVLVGLAGVTWAMATWAPFAIISAEISRRDAIRVQKARVTDPDLPEPLDRAIARAEHAWEDAEEEIDEAGVIMGIHNMSIAAPQILTTFVSSIIFKIFQKPRGTPGDRSLSAIMALGGLCVLVAAAFVARIEESTSATFEHPDDGERGGPNTRGVTNSDRAAYSHSQGKGDNGARAVTETTQGS